MSDAWADRRKTVRRWEVRNGDTIPSYVEILETRVTDDGVLELWVLVASEGGD